MGNLRVCFAIATLAACGSESKQPDAGITLIDSPMPDAKVWNDAPPKNYDLTCLNNPPPTTAPSMLNVTGTTQEFGMGGGSALGGVVMGVYKRNDPSTSYADDTSDTASATLGEFQLNNIPTGGAPFDGYLKAAPPQPQNAAPTHRITHMFPPSVVDQSLADVPVIIISEATFGLFEAVQAQDDSVNGALLFLVTDCSNSTLISEAQVSVEQNGTSEGATFGLAIADPQLAGTFVTLNVTEGIDTDIKVTYNGMAFPTKKVRTFAAAGGQNQPGTVSFTIIRPGH
jgi:hypothetical protein